MTGNKGVWIHPRSILAVIEELLRGKGRQRNGSGSGRGYRSRRTIVTVSEEWIACMHARDGRREKGRRKPACIRFKVNVLSARWCRQVAGI
jgi:hypothetical protein